MNSIITGQIIETIETNLEKNLYRVVWVDNGQQIVAIFNIFKEDALPEIVSYQSLATQLADGSAHQLEIDPFRYVALVAAGVHAARRDRCMESIRDLVENHLEELFYSSSRGKLTRNAAKKYGTSKTQILKRLRRYWARGMIPNAMLPDFKPPPKNDQLPIRVGSGKPGEDKPDTDRRRGRPRPLDRAIRSRGEYKITSDHKQRIYRGYTLYHIEKKYPIPKAYEATLFTLFNNGYEIDPKSNLSFPVLPDSSFLPSIDQFTYWGEKQVTAQKRRRSRIKNQLTIPLKDRPILGDATSSIPGPGFEYQIDSTIGDIYLVSARDRTRIIGRPVIYMVVDTFSRLIVGFAVTLEGPSWECAMIALESVTKDKVALCAEYGITIDDSDWPSRHLCQWLLGDRGELMSGNAKNMIEGLSIRVSNNKPYRPDWKAVVERNFKLINDETIKWQPGAVYDRIERGGPDYRLDAKYTLNEFRKLIILHIIEHNTTHRLDSLAMADAMVADHVEPYAVERWAWGVKNQGGSLREERDQMKVMCNLIPEEDAVITNRGIDYKDLLYEPTSPELIWEIQKARDRRKHIKVVPVPDSTHQIYVRMNNGMDVVECFLTSRHMVYDNHDWYEIIDEQELKLQNREAGTNDRRAKLAKIRAQRESLEDYVESQTPDTSSMTKSSRTGSIKANRREEIEADRQKAALANQPDQNPELPDNKNGNTAGSATHLDSNREILNALKAKKQK